MRYQEAVTLKRGERVVVRSRGRGATWHGKITKIQRPEGTRKPLILVDISTGDPSWPRLIEVRHERVYRRVGS
jgi:hypothetical protein